MVDEHEVKKIRFVNGSEITFKGGSEKMVGASTRMWDRYLEGNKEWERIMTDKKTDLEEWLESIDGLPIWDGQTISDNFHKWIKDSKLIIRAQNEALKFYEKQDRERTEGMVTPIAYQCLAAVDAIVKGEG